MSKHWTWERVCEVMDSAIEEGGLGHFKLRGVPAALFMQFKGREPTCYEQSAGWGYSRGYRGYAVCTEPNAADEVVCIK
jgi:hypothetical protein